MERVTIYTDGACLGNPGPGGWAAVIVTPRGRREITGFEPATTNNRMELRAALEGLRALPPASAADLHTDSQYVRNGMHEWLARWKRNGWRTADRKPVKNDDLWRALDEAAAAHDVRWHWVRGHDGNVENERCDTLANEAIREGLARR
jgi:ribonuclease HI